MATEKRRDLIDRQALEIGRCDPDAFPLQNRGYAAGWNGVISLFEQAPAIDAVEVVHGRWVKAYIAGYLKCNCCQDAFIYEEWLESGKWNYCPNCGAKMDGGTDNG